MNKMSIPKLRFSEFSDKWKSNKLSKVAKVTSGGTPNRSEEKYWNGTIPWVSTSLINFNTIFSSEEYITKKGLENSSAKLFPIGTILLAMYGQGKTRGKVAILGIEASTNQACSAIIPDDAIHNNYLFQNLIGRYDEIRRLSNEGGQQNLSGSIIKDIPIRFPNLPEQQKIASFLSDVDNKITKLTKKKDLLEQYKKGIMQKIFNQELRFKDDNGNEFPKWEEKKLGELCNITTGKLDANAMVENGEYRFYTCAKDFFKIDKYSFDLEALLISGNGANVGYVHYYKGKFNAYQRTYVLYNLNQSYSYVKYFLDKFIQKRIHREKKDGNTPYIVMETLSEMIISVPSIEEQTKIANLLSDIDVKIKALNTQIENSKAFKKGLLQQMFV